MTNTMPQTTTATLLWSAILAATAIFGSYGFACVFPFAAVAAIAAVTVPGARAFALMAAVWAANQIVGFTLMDYASGSDALVWGGVIGAGSIAAVAAARFAFGPETRLIALRTVVALVASVAAYQAVMFVGAWALDGFASSTPEIVAAIVRNDALWFAGLIALRLVLTNAAPRLFVKAPALA